MKKRVLAVIAAILLTMTMALPVAASEGISVPSPQFEAPGDEDPTAPQNNSSTSPKTGDEMDMMPVAAAALVFAGTAAAAKKRLDVED